MSGTNATLTIMSPDELTNIYGGDVIGAACTLYGGYAAVTGGAVLLTPVGGAAGLFCAGWAVGRLIGSWIG